MAVSRKGQHNGHHGWRTLRTEEYSLLQTAHDWPLPQKAWHYIKIKNNEIRKTSVFDIDNGVLDYVGIVLTNMKYAHLDI